MHVYGISGSGHIKAFDPAEPSPLWAEFMGIETEELVRRDPRSLAKAYSVAVWAFRCVMLRANSIASVPWAVYSAKDDKPLPGHPLAKLLNVPELWQATEACLMIFGVAYWLKVRNRLRKLLELRNLNPLTMEVEADPAKGITGYTQRVGVQAQKFTPEDIIYFRIFNPLSDVSGLSPLATALEAVLADRQARLHALAFFKNAARPDGLLYTERPLSEEEVEKITHWWQRLFGGISRAWRVGVLGGGLKYEPITVPPKDLAFQELTEQNRRDICAAFGVPPALAGAWEAANYATADAQRESFWKETILPQLSYYREKLQKELVPLFGEDIYVDYDASSVEALQEDAVKVAQRLNILVRAGVMTINEARAELGLPPTSGGDIILLPLGSAGVPAEAQKAIVSLKPTGTLEELRHKWEHKLYSALLELWGKHQRLIHDWLLKRPEVQKRAYKALPRDLTADKELWETIANDLVLLFVPSLEGITIEAITNAIANLPFEVGVDLLPINQAAQKWAREYSYELVKGLNETTREALSTTIVNWIESGEALPALEARLRAIFENPYRASMIAATEVTRAFAYGNRLAWEATGVIKAYRVEGAADEKVCPLCQEHIAHGPYPIGDTSHMPPFHPNCRCWIVPEV